MTSAPLPRIGKSLSILAIIAIWVFLFDSATAQQAGELVSLPARFEGNRVFVEPQTSAGAKLNLFTDTGGGLFLYRKAAERLHIPIVAEGDLELATLPSFQHDMGIPLPLTRGGKIPVFSPPPGERPEEILEFDGMLGQEWFAGRVWVFDYRRKTLEVSHGQVRPSSAAKSPLGFKLDQSGKRLLNFPRIQATVDGERLDFLLDTGATTSLQTAVVDQLKDGLPAERATCFVVATIFDKWKKRHPDWRLIQTAEAGSNAPMIEVPRIEIAGHSVGPIWFTRRADRNFHEFMSQFMDRRVEGALGGNALQFFRLTIDYPNAVAWFERYPSGRASTFRRLPGPSPFYAFRIYLEGWQ